MNYQKGVNSGYILKVVTSMISGEDASNQVENFVCLNTTYNEKDQGI